MERTKIRDVYEIKELIGTGRFAKVYRAEHLFMKRDVAVKIVDPALVSSDPTLIRRFLSEAQVSFDLRHNNIVTVHDVGEENGLLFMVMEYIDGDPLEEIIKSKGPLPLDQVLDILSGIGSALDYAHEAGLIHRNVKSSNIFIKKLDNRPILVDFGIAKVASSQALTQVGFQAGTPEYMSPEQANGDAATKLSDLYALGIVAYEMLTGNVPFKANTPAVTLFQQLTHIAPSVTEIRKDIPGYVADAITRMLSKNPMERYQSAADFVAALRNAPIEPVAPVTPPVIKIEAPVQQEIPLPEPPVEAKTGPIKREPERELPLPVHSSDMNPGEPDVTPSKPRRDSRRNTILILAVITGVLGVAIIVLAFLLKSNSSLLRKEQEKYPVPQALVTRQVSVSIEIEGSPEVNYQISKIRSEPSSVEIKGQENLISGISEIPTQPFNIEGINGMMESEISLVSPDPSITITPGTVKVIIEVTRKESIQKEIRISVTIEESRPEYEYSVYPSEIVINVKGPSGVIDQLDLNAMSTSINVKNFTQGTYQVLIDKPLFPDNLEILGDIPDKVSLVVKAKEINQPEEGSM